MDGNKLHKINVNNDGAGNLLPWGCLFVIVICSIVPMDTGLGVVL